MTRQEHWNAIFKAKADPELGWHEEDTSQTLRFLNKLPLPSRPMTFLAGAGTSPLVDALLAREHHLVLNDISDTALAKLHERIGTPPKTRWLHQDIARPLPSATPPIDLWIDRAVLHFLLSENEINAYFDNVRRVVKPNGWVLLAEFSAGGAPKCANLQVHRYTVDEMSTRLGPGFTLHTSEPYTYINPVGQPRPYVYALYRRDPE